jgi:hypothetical protein
MAYLEHDDRELDMGSQSDFYDDEAMYEELYETDSFGERIDSGSETDELMEEEDVEIIDTPTSMGGSTNHVEQGFGEAINPASNPHIDDQLADEKLQSEAEAEYLYADHDDSSE